MEDELAEALKGAIDLHTHPAPDIVPRSQTVAEAMDDFTAAGFAGFVAKSHVGSTAPVCSGHTSGLGAVAIGSICLNRPVGGLNAAAVEVAARLGARVVWLPTVDSRRQREQATVAGPAPVWAETQAQLARTRGYGPPIPVLDDGRVVPELHDVLDVVRDHGMLLATGHLDCDEVFAVVDAAKEHGIERIVVTHPDLPRQRITLDAQVEMARRGAWIERTLASVIEGKLTIDAALHGIRACGTGSTLLTGDLGQPPNGPIIGGIRHSGARAASSYGQNGLSAPSVVRTGAVRNGAARTSGREGAAVTTRHPHSQSTSTGTGRQTLLLGSPPRPSQEAGPNVSRSAPSHDHTRHRPAQVRATHSRSAN